MRVHTTCKSMSYKPERGFQDFWATQYVNDNIKIRLSKNLLVVPNYRSCLQEWICFYSTQKCAHVCKNHIESFSTYLREQPSVRRRRCRVCVGIHTVSVSTNWFGITFNLFHSRNVCFSYEIARLLVPENRRRSQGKPIGSFVFV